MLNPALSVGSRDKRAETIPRGTYLRVLLALSLLSALLPLLLWLLGRLDHPIGALISAYFFFPLLLLLVACLVGAAFPLAGQVDFVDSATTTSRAFLADYMGAFFGALLVSTLLIPLAGVITACLITAGLNLLATGVVWVRRG